MALVHDILAFSMETPKIVDQLDLWDEVRGWIPPVSRPKSVANVDEEPQVELIFSSAWGAIYGSIWGVFNSLVSVDLSGCLSILLLTSHFDWRKYRQILYDNFEYISLRPACVAYCLLNSYLDFSQCGAPLHWFLYIKFAGKEN